MKAPAGCRAAFPPCRTGLCQPLNLLIGYEGSVTQRRSKTAFKLFARTVLKEYDIVKISSLREPNRACDGTESVMREPRVGDKGIVVHVLGKDSEEMKYIVECVNPEGFTVWVADFWEGELEKSDAA